MLRYHGTQQTGSAAQPCLQSENDEIITIADSEKGNELMAETGKKVEVKGTVAESDGSKTITVDS